MSQTPDSYYVGDWLIEPALLRISRNGEIKKIEPQLMAVLQYLVARSGIAVKKKDLMEAVWRDVIVTDNVLARAVSSLRKALEDDRFNPNYIETISKTGYRLVAEVKPKKTSASDEVGNLTKIMIIASVGLISLFALGAFASKNVFYNTSNKTYQPLALANYSNTEYWPTISPDGKFVAYSWRGEKNDNWDIYAKRIGVEATAKITETPSTELRPKWSPDGRFIYFLRYENGKATIYKKTILGETEIRVLEAPRYSQGDFDISPDEQWISFNAREDPASPLRLKLLSLTTGEEKWLTSPKGGFNGDIHPTFSANGNQLAFIREKNSASMQLCLFDLNTEKENQITSEHISINGFDWSPDDKSLFYASNRSGLYKLWQVRLSDKKSKILSTGDYQMVMPRVAETGRMIYAKMKDNVNIWTYKLGEKTAKTWLATNDLNLNPVFSSNGKKICFTMNKNDVFQIWTANSDGTNKTPVTQFTGQYLTSPRWSPDNKYIVFQGFLDGQADIYKVNAAGGIAENLTKSAADDHTPFFATNNKIYFSSNQDGEWGVWSMSSDGSKTLKIIGADAYAPQLSPDAKVCYYAKKGTPGLWAYDLERKREDLIVKAFHPMYWGAFTVVEKGVYYLNAQNKQLEYFDFESGKSSFVYQPQARIPRLGVSLHFSPDSRQLLFSQIDHHDADIMLLEEEP